MAKETFGPIPWGKNYIELFFSSLRSSNAHSSHSNSSRLVAVRSRLLPFHSHLIRVAHSVNNFKEEKEERCIRIWYISSRILFPSVHNAHLYSVSVWCLLRIGFGNATAASISFAQYTSFTLLLLLLANRLLKTIQAWHILHHSTCSIHTIKTTKFKRDWRVYNSLWIGTTADWLCTQNVRIFIFHFIRMSIESNVYLTWASAMCNINTCSVISMNDSLKTILFLFAPVRWMRMGSTTKLFERSSI